MPCRTRWPQTQQPKQTRRSGVTRDRSASNRIGGQTDKEVDFLARGAGYSLFLSRAEATMVLHGAMVRMEPVGAKCPTPPKALDQQSSKSNYFIGNFPARWHTGIPNYAKIRYVNVYPGVDLIYYGNQRQLEYDFVVKPGADPGRIALQFDGPAKPVLDPSGDLFMQTSAGDLRWRQPVAYQQVNGSRKLVACAYTRKGGDRLGFTLDAYDRTKPLIIDPILEYSTYLGGRNEDEGNGIAVDAHENAYVTGYTTSPDFPIKNAFQSTFSGFAAFITKFDALGSLVYSTYLSGSGGINQGRGVAVDAHGNAYVTGYTTAADFPIKNAFQPTLRISLGNSFVTKLNAAGNGLIYSTYLGGSQPTLIDDQALDFGDQAAAIVVDALGYAYIAGTSGTTDFPTKNAFQSSHGGGNLDAFITKLCPAGNALVYSTYLGGSDDDYAGGIALDVRRNPYVTGTTFSSDFPTKNAFQNNKLSGGGDAFVTKFNAGGDVLIYSTYLGGSGGDAATGIAVDAHGNAYVAGRTDSTDFPVKNAFQKNLKGEFDGFVTKFDAAGTALVYSTYLGGTKGEDERAVAVDARGNAYVTGGTTSSDFPIKDAFQNELKGSENAFVTKLCPAGTLVYSSYLGGTAGDIGSGIALDVRGAAYLTGSTGSTDFPTKNAFQPMQGGPGAINAFVTKISAK